MVLVMKILSMRNVLSLIAICGVTALMSGCATSRQPVAQGAGQPATAGDFLKGMDIVEQPELEPDWAAWVKDYYPNWRAHYWVDRGQWGNRGYLVGKAPSSELAPVSTEMTPLPPVAMIEAPTAPSIVESTPPVIEKVDRPTSYTVKKGDSLWKIAGRVYRNPLKWPRIYRANQDKIKNPHRIYPGQVLTIPQD